MESCLTSAVQRFLADGVFSSAIFLAERLVAEHANEANVALLAEAYYRSGDGHRAIALLQRPTEHGGPRSPQNRYMLALCCYEAGRLSEAETALLPPKSSRSPPGMPALEPIPNGAAGLFLMGSICRRVNRTEHAIEYFKASLKQDPFMWSAYEGLCELGCDAPTSTFLHPALLPTFKGKKTVRASGARPVSSRPAVSTRPPPATDTTAQRPRKVVAPLQGKKAMSRTFTEKDRPTKLRIPAPSTTTSGGDTPSPAHASGDAPALQLLHDCGAAYRALCLFECDTAIQCLMALPRSQLTSAWAQQQLARAYFEQANYPKAARIYEGIREADPHRMEGMAIYSTILYHLKHEVGLSYLAQQLTEFDKRSSDAWFVAGNCFSLQKEHDMALTFFQRLNPYFTYAHTLCGHEYAANEDFEKAIGCYRHALRVDGRHYNAWYGLGAIYLRQEKLELAEYHFRRALSINPQSSILHCNLGMVLHAVQRHDEAIAALDIAQHLQPLNSTARFHKAKVLLATHRYKAALDELYIVRDAAPKESSVHFLLGRVAKKLGQVDEAMRHYNNALFFHPKDNHLIKAAIERLYDDNDRDSDDDDDQM
ncbi:anaphase-promoting complex subunit 3, variant [Saprolegnia diclina VS20]|uniref:Anaphase-promoting complex subunit 3, variant n=1 Tax=Saprolegnia diclina (strain VS20) TaxID=1156394 RepID=T0QNZ5_SAPDV|nr:anaphase-promoting complex subunit 3, variant [Saprolegnia diclina VS20]EQC35560.1 anaphase-promoting complex subunit 3, variant [Saprolegnia diclina VS20]|eukprot:XP_008610877.1 anaphase-promoting complex subunit 3, variant [Saprolegnia diclina VS20]